MTTISNTIRERCVNFSRQERKTVLAYCCYVVFLDKSVRQAEVQTINQVAKDLEIEEQKVRKYVRKARRRRLKVRRPKSEAVCNLLLLLAIQLACADNVIDPRERDALRRLAKQLNVDPSIVDDKLNSVKFTDTQTATTGVLATLSDALLKDMVVDRLEADLFSHPRQERSFRKGEVEWSVQHDGDVVLNVELDDIGVAAGETLVIRVNEIDVANIEFPDGRFDEQIALDRKIKSDKLAIASRVEVLHRNEVILSGAFER